MLKAAKGELHTQPWPGEIVCKRREMIEFTKLHYATLSSEGERLMIINGRRSYLNNSPCELESFKMRLELRCYWSYHRHQLKQT